ncbi:MAG: DMT family transporter [Novosphingobium sp.]|nr:DMT family transporter [Novosphingobium sp.]
MTAQRAFLPFVATVAGIAVFSAMDAVMKGAALAAGVYTAVFLRNSFGAAMMTPVWLMAGRPMAGRKALVVHVQRAFVTSGMALLFFYALTILPLAEAIALSFIAPLIALYLAALLLGERIQPSAIIASVLGLAGVVVIAATRLGNGEISANSATGIAALLCSAVLYALNLVLQRKQAMLSGPVEIALVQNLFMALILATAAPWWLHWPESQDLGLIALAAFLAILALLMLSWAYARAEAQALVPVEYTGFLWAALFGWLMFAEPVGLATVAGALLIVIGSWIAARRQMASNPPQPPPQPPPQALT